MFTSPDVVVIGGGIIGCASAWRLAQAGARVMLLERDVPGRAATWAAAGMLSPLSEVHHPKFLELAEASFLLYPDFVAELRVLSGDTIEFGTPGKLAFAFNDADHAHFGARVPQMLTDVAARELEPEVAPDVIGAAWFPRDGFVDNRALGAALARAAVLAGVELRPGEEVRAIRSENAKVLGVLLDSGAIDCETVVLAGGAWSGDLPGLPRRLPVLPVKGQMVALHTELRIIRMLQSPDCYLIPRSGNRVLVGATVEHAGFDARNTAYGLEVLLTAARRLVPGLGDAEPIEAWTGFRPGTPDDLPILGREPELPGLVYATGHYRNGILLAPLTAQLVAAVVSGRDADVLVEPFLAQRFG